MIYSTCGNRDVPDITRQEADTKGHWESFNLRRQSGRSKGGILAWL
jgi:hypothetical protein